MRQLIIWIVAILLIGGALYSGFTYLKQKPPTALIELVTKTDPPPPLPQGNQAPFTVPSGFIATIYSRETPGARVLTRDQKGTMLVSLTATGKVVALPDFDGNGVSDETRVVLEGLKQPHGILVHCPDTGNGSVVQDDCTLYVAETGALKAYSYDADTMSASAGETLTPLPTGSGHFTRTLLMHPDGKRLLVSVGSSCNVCTEDDARRATILAYDLDTKVVSIFATGLRNTVFMATDPVKGEVWGTDNGRDILGDDIPPDEVNIIQEGKNYGWPICYGNRIYDTDFEKGDNENACAETLAPHIALQAHSAALGLAFIPEEGWPEGMRSDILVAYHGSWNRSEPTGYKVVRFDLNDNRVATSGAIDFMTGFLAEGAETDNAIGRPVGLLAEPSGSLYVSDDRAGAIYHISTLTPQ